MKSMASEDGFSVVELMIATVVLSLVIGGLYGAFDSTQTFYESYRDAAALRQQARVGLDLLSSELRMTGYDLGDAAEALVGAGDTSVQFVGDIDDGDTAEPCDGSYENADGGGAERVAYTLDTNSGDLVRTVDCFDGSSWTTGVQSSMVARDLDVNASVFRFFDADGNQLPSSSGGTLSASERARVVSIEIIFDIIETGETQLVGETHANLNLTTRIRLHNAAE